MKLHTIEDYQPRTIEYCVNADSGYLETLKLGLGNDNRRVWLNRMGFSIPNSHVCRTASTEDQLDLKVLELTIGYYRGFGVTWIQFTLGKEYDVRYDYSWQEF